MCSQVEHALSELHKWCDANTSRVNVKKTQYMRVTPNRAMCPNVPYELKMVNSTFQIVNAYNYLGVRIDHELLLIEFLNRNKINQRLYQFEIHYITILPLFDYSDFLIDGGPMYYIRKIDNLYEKAV